VLYSEDGEEKIQQQQEKVLRAEEDSLKNLENVISKENVLMDNFLHHII